MQRTIEIDIIDDQHELLLSEIEESDDSLSEEDLKKARVRAKLSVDDVHSRYTEPLMSKFRSKSFVGFLDKVPKNDAETQYYIEDFEGIQGTKPQSATMSKVSAPSKMKSSTDKIHRKSKMEKMEDSKSADDSFYESDNTPESRLDKNDEYSYTSRGRRKKKKHTKKGLSPDCKFFAEF